MMMETYVYGDVTTKRGAGGQGWIAYWRCDERIWEYRATEDAAIGALYKRVYIEQRNDAAKVNDKTQ